MGCVPRREPLAERAGHTTGQYQPHESYPAHVVAASFFGTAIEGPGLLATQAKRVIKNKRRLVPCGEGAGWDRACDAPGRRNGNSSRGLIMGVWGTGLLSSDEGRGFLNRARAGGVRVVRSQIRKVLATPADGLIDQDLALECIAAAVIVALSLNRPLPEVGGDSDTPAGAWRLAVTPNDVEGAKQAVEWIAERSELKMNFGATPEGSAWRQSLRNLLNALHGAPAQRVPIPKPAHVPKPGPGQVVAAAGQVVAIPISGHLFAHAQVVWVSRRARGCILIRAASAAGPEPRPPAVIGDPGPLLYTTDFFIEKGYWPVVGLHDLPSQAEQLSLRIEGEEVWLADKFVRAATPADQAALPAFCVHGTISAEHRIVHHLAARQLVPPQTVAEIATRRGGQCLTRGEFKDAAGYFTAAVLDDPRYALAYWGRACAQQQLGKKKLAEADRVQAIELDPLVAGAADWPQLGRW